MTTAYPPAFRADLQEIINGYLVADPYRWLEDPAGEQTLSWLTGQDALYAEHLAALPVREPLAARLTELLGAGSISTPAWRGGRRFFLRRAAGQEHAVLYTAAASDERALIDPMQIDPSGTTTLDAWQPDKEGRLPADAVPDGEEQYHRRVYLHRVGTSADDDTMIFGDGGEKTNYYLASVSMDGRWLLIGASAGTAPRNDLWLANLTESGEAAPDLRVLQQGVDAQTMARAGRDGMLYIL